MYYTIKDKNFNKIKVQYNLYELTNIDKELFIQKLIDLQENLYNESTDCVDASYTLGNILDEIIDIKM